MIRSVIVIGCIMELMLQFVLRKSFSARAVARCHGYDLYADRYISNYLPLRFYLSSYLDVIFPISKHGLDYLKGNILFLRVVKLEVSRLGTLIMELKVMYIWKEHFDWYLVLGLCQSRGFIGY